VTIANSSIFIFSLDRQFSQKLHTDILKLSRKATMKAFAILMLAFGSVTFAAAVIPAGKSHMGWMSRHVPVFNMRTGSLADRMQTTGGIQCISYVT
jgi:hypothetical protein